MSSGESEPVFCNPRVMRRHLEGSILYAFHDVYTDSFGKVVCYSEDSISNTASSIANLKENLEEILSSASVEFILGELEYIYTKEDIADWLNHINDEVIDYEDE